MAAGAFLPNFLIMEQRILQANHHHLALIICEYQKTYNKLKGQSFFLFKISRDKDLYNKEAIPLNEQLPLTEEVIEGLIDNIIKNHLFIVIEELKKASDFPYTLAHFKQTDIGKAPFHAFKKETCEFLVDQLECESLRNQLIIYC